MGYLRYFDYQKLIQDANFQQIIASNDNLRIDAERAAQAEMISYLVQKYDTTQEFVSTTVWDYSVAYPVNSLVELNFTLYSATSLYPLNSLVTFAGKEYINTTAITVAEAFTLSKWKLLGNQYDLFYIAPPYPVFNYKEFYNIGDKVFWKGKVYQCLVQTQPISQSVAIQYDTIANLPLLNVFPDSPSAGKANWGIGVTYVPVAGLLPTATSTDYTAWSSVTTYVSGNKISYASKIWLSLGSSTNIIPGTDITKWQSIGFTSGDNRSQQLVMYMVDIVLFHLHSRIAPRNIPQLRYDRYRNAKQWLKDAANAIITADLPVIQPAQGNVIRFGGNVKLRNDY